MRDILKIVRFDLLTAAPFAVRGFVLLAVLCVWMGIFYAPITLAFIIFGALLFILPLNGVAEKSDFSKLYGQLPVSRKSITKGRFMYIFLVCFLTELAEIVLAVASHALKLYRVLPDRNSALLEEVGYAFEQEAATLFAIFLLFGIVCISASYMEMKIQIYGSENIFRIILTTFLKLFGVFAVLCVYELTVGFIYSGLNYCLAEIVDYAGSAVCFGIVVNIVSFALCLLHSFRTGRKLSGREL